MLKNYNVGQHLKNTANSLMILGFIFGIYLLVYAISYFEEPNWLYVGISISSVLIGIWQRMLLYGFGELVESSKETAEILKNYTKWILIIKTKRQ